MITPVDLNEIEAMASVYDSFAPDLVLELISELRLCREYLRDSIRTKGWEQVIADQLAMLASRREPTAKDRAWAAIIAAALRDRS